MRRDIESLRGTIAFGLITIREDEAEALLDRFEVPDSAFGRGDYDIGVVGTLEGAEHQFALVRCSQTGQGIAQKAAHDLIEDLAPRLILLVGIGGAVPSKDFTLGDVVCAMRVHDFSVRAALEGRPDEFDVRGGPMHRRVEKLLSRLPVLLRKPSLEGWNSSDAISCKLPQVVVPSKRSNRYYGSDGWKNSVRESLEYHFPKGKQQRPRLVTARPVASSDALVKDTETVHQWSQSARSIADVEMELGGVYIAARGDTEVPILAIRGISDVVGFKRGEEWTKFACHSAAAFAFALVKSGELDHLLQFAKVIPGRPIIDRLSDSATTGVEAAELLQRHLGSTDKLSPHEMRFLQNEYDAFRLRRVLLDILGLHVQQMQLPMVIRGYVEDTRLGQESPWQPRWPKICELIGFLQEKVGRLMEVLWEFDGDFLVYKLDDYRNLLFTLKERDQTLSELLTFVDPHSPQELDRLLVLAGKYDELIRHLKTSEDIIAQYIGEGRVERWEPLGTWVSLYHELDTWGPGSGWGTMETWTEIRRTSSKLERYLSQNWLEKARLQGADRQWYLLPAWSTQELRFGLRFGSADQAAVAEESESVKGLTDGYQDKWSGLSLVRDGKWLILTIPKDSFLELVGSVDKVSGGWPRQGTLSA